MAKIKSAFFCKNCGFESPKWMGKCTACGEWNTFVEETVSAPNNKTVSWQKNVESAPVHAQSIEEIAMEQLMRISLPDNELNRVLGGGLVPGSVVLVAGEPGIGKSTLFLQCALQFPQLKTLYVSGEESASQIKLRAQRMEYHNSNLFLLTTTSVDTIFQEIKNVQPDWLIIDSIQTLELSHLESIPGSISQVKEAAGALQKFAKQSHVPVCIIGHINKEGSIAGPKVLEHMVDVVLQFEGDRHYAYRILRTLKNRFGSTSELGIYEMTASGMRGVLNPSEILLSQHEENLSGIAIAATMEGARPLMIEVQALVTQSVYGTPQRTSNGYDAKRLQLLLAVLEKRGGFHFGMKDVFLNITGGLKIEDPSIDLAIVCALLSSYEDVVLPANICFVGEVGLSGEIRAVNRVEQRIAEAAKLGMDAIVLPKANQKQLQSLPSSAIAIHFANKVSDVYALFFQR